MHVLHGRVAVALAGQKVVPATHAMTMVLFGDGHALPEGQAAHCVLAVVLQAVTVFWPAPQTRQDCGCASPPEQKNPAGQGSMFIVEFWKY